MKRILIGFLILIGSYNVFAIGSGGCNNGCLRIVRQHLVSRQTFNQSIEVPYTETVAGQGVEESYTFQGGNAPLFILHTTQRVSLSSNPPIKTPPIFLIKNLSQTEFLTLESSFRKGEVLKFAPVLLTFDTYLAEFDSQGQMRSCKRGLQYIFDYQANGVTFEGYRYVLRLDVETESHVPLADCHP